MRKVQRVQTTASFGDGAETILWDVVDEHLAEAEFLFAQWSSPVVRTSLSLEQMRRTVEARLVAHLDGLAVGGDAVAARVLWPALRGVPAGGDHDVDVDPEQRTAAALALVESAAAGSLEAVLAFADGEGPPDGAAAVDRALEIASRADVDAALAAALAGATPARSQSLLGVLAARRADPGPPLAALLGGDDLGRLGAALRAGAAVRSPEVRPLVTHLLRSNARQLRATATQVAVEWGMEAGWKACLERVRRGDPRLLPPLALFGGPGDLRPVVDALADPKRREHALWALGFSGRSEAVDAVVPLLGADDRTARLAGEVITAITGVAIDDDLRRPPPPEPDELPDLEEDLGIDLRPDPADGLPLPAAEAVAAWWAANRQRFAPSERYLLGRPYSAETVREALLRAPLRRFEVLAFELGVRTEGRVLLPRLRLGLEVPPASAFAGADFQSPPRWT
jgi:uncharacterized protein (TIGR02270 family)